MILKIPILVLIGISLVVFQSVFLVDLMPLGITPDLALLFSLLVAWRYGQMLGVLCGFSLGIVCDILGIAPLGFHAFLFTLIGYLFGLLYDTISPRGLFLPILTTLMATLIKYCGAYLLNLVIQLDSKILRFIGLKTLIEITLNCILAPGLFMLFAFFARLSESHRRGFQ